MLTPPRADDSHADPDGERQRTDRPRSRVDVRTIRGARAVVGAHGVDAGGERRGVAPAIGVVRAHEGPERCPLLRRRVTVVTGHAGGASSAGSGERR